MTGTNHVLTGMAIGLAVHQPVLAIPLALASHFVLDALPHYGGSENSAKQFLIVLGIDGTVIATILAGLLITQPAYWPLAIVCGLVAASPDFMWLPNFLRELHDHKLRKPYTDPISRFHKNIQWAEKSYNWPYELAWLLALAVLLTQLLH